MDTDTLQEEKDSDTSKEDYTDLIVKGSPVKNKNEIKAKSRDYK